MKKQFVLFVGILFWSFAGNAQNDSLLAFLRGTWITPSCNLMIIKSIGDTRSARYFACSPNYLESTTRANDFELFNFQDTLSFRRLNYRDSLLEKYDFKIIQLDSINLKIRQLDKPSASFFGDTGIITFTKQQFAIDKSIKFEKLVYQTTQCFGTCPAYNLEIDRNGKTKLYANTVFKKNTREEELDSLKMGYFDGKLTDSQYKKLIFLLQTCNLRTITFNGGNCCDGSFKTIIIYFNGQKKVLKAMFPPKLAENLISFLYNYCENGTFSRSKEKFNIED